MNPVNNKIKQTYSEEEYRLIVSEMYLAYEKLADSLIKNEMTDAYKAVLIAYKAFEREVFDKIKQENKVQ